MAVGVRAEDEAEGEEGSHEMTMIGSLESHWTCERR